MKKEIEILAKKNLFAGIVIGFAMAIGVACVVGIVLMVILHGNG